jgi:hypothetical protein
MKNINVIFSEMSKDEKSECIKMLFDGLSLEEKSDAISTIKYEYMTKCSMCNRIIVFDDNKVVRCGCCAKNVCHHCGGINHQIGTNLRGGSSVYYTCQDCRRRCDEKGPMAKPDDIKCNGCRNNDSKLLSHVHYPDGCCDLAICHYIKFGQAHESMRDLSSDSQSESDSDYESISDCEL